MIDLFDYFDDVVCITIYENFERNELLKKKLHEANIKDNIRFDIQTKYPAWFRHRYPNDVCATMRHYDTIKSLLFEDKKKVLILENDIVFRKDYNITKYYLDRMPEDADIIQFDYNIMPFKPDTNKDYINVNNLIMNCNYVCYCAGGNVYNHSTMKKMVNIMDNDSDIIIDQVPFKLDNIKHYIPNNALCCQKYNQDNRTDRLSPDILYEIYRKNGTNVEDFV